MLFGASGSGKTTIFRCLAGLERPETRIIFSGQGNWVDAGENYFPAPTKRGVGFVPQDYVLVSQRSVPGNVGYGLKEIAAAQHALGVAETLHWLGLDGLEHRLPQELSGGQQQRVVLGPAVVRQPKLLLLDEPLYNHS